MVARHPDHPGEGWKKRKGFCLLEFLGGAAEGNTIRWQEAFIPPHWNHVERKMDPLLPDENGELPDGVEISGELKIGGVKHFISELRLWHRYQRTIKIGTLGAQIYEPVSGSPVPLLYDSVTKTWESPEEWAARKGHYPEDEPSTSSLTLLPPDTVAPLETPTEE